MSQCFANIFNWRSNHILTKASPSINVLWRISLRQSFSTYYCSFIRIVVLDLHFSRQGRVESFLCILYLVLRSSSWMHVNYNDLRWLDPQGKTSVRINPILPRIKLWFWGFIFLFSRKSLIEALLIQRNMSVCEYFNIFRKFPYWKISCVEKGYIYFLHILYCQGRNYLGDCISSVLFAFWPR